MGGVIAFPAGPARWAPGLANDFSGLSHDLRNVMASLELCAEVLAQPGVLMPDHAYLAGEIRSVADASIGLLRQIGRLAERDASRAALPSLLPEEPQETAQHTAAPTHGGLSSLLSHIERLLVAVAGPGINLQVACAPCWGRLAMPVHDLERVLINLVCNASQAMPQGGRIRIAAQMSGGQSFAGVATDLPLAPAHAVTLSVQDDGPGIPAVIADRIFERGFSAQSTNSRRRRSSSKQTVKSEEFRGLGLAIVRDLVESCGGTIALVPSVRGARFEMELPLTNVTLSPGLRTRIPVKGGRA